MPAAVCMHAVDPAFDDIGTISVYVDCASGYLVVDNGLEDFHGGIHFGSGDRLLLGDVAILTLDISFVGLDVEVGLYPGPPASSDPRVLGVLAARTV